MGTTLSSFLTRERPPMSIGGLSLHPGGGRLPLGAERPPLHNSETGAMTTARLATTEYWRDKDGAQQERTDWHRLVFFGRLAEIAGEYLKKGSKLGIEGRLQTRKWQTEQEEERNTTKKEEHEKEKCDRAAPEAKEAERPGMHRRR